MSNHIYCENYSIKSPYDYCMRTLSGTTKPLAEYNETTNTLTFHSYMVVKGTSICNAKPQIKLIQLGKTNLDLYICTSGYCPSSELKIKTGKDGFRNVKLITEKQMHDIFSK
jgi:hypothetical protein